MIKSKTKIRKNAGLVCILFLASFIAGCTNNGNDGKWRYSDLINYSEYISFITGAKAVTNTVRWDVGGTDLGFPIYNSITNEMLYAFGDTFGDPGQTTTWRSNTLAISSDFEFGDGITIDDYYKGASGKAKAVIDGHHNLTFGYEATKIPTGGIEIDGNLYMFYMSIRQWDCWLVNYNGVVKSTDNGATWSRIYDLTWALTDGVSEIKGVGIQPGYTPELGFSFTPESVAADAVILANQTVDLQNREQTAADYITLDGRVAPNFGQIFPIDGRDGYIYIMGIPGGRGVGTKLGRVAKANFERFDEYEYYTGKDGSGNPVFVKGSAGLNLIYDNDDSFVINERCGELSFMYNAYLKKWISVNSIGAGLSFRTADNLWGDWSVPNTICYSEDVQPINNGTTYGGHVHEKLTEQNGKIFYVVLSQWMPTYNSSLIKVVLK